MTDGEFSEVLAAWAAYWPAQAEIPTGAVAAIWRDLWEGYTAREVGEALRDLARDGREFPPPPGVVAKTVEKRRTDVTVARVMAELFPPAGEEEGME